MYHFHTFSAALATSYLSANTKRDRQTSIFLPSMTVPFSRWRTTSASQLWANVTNPKPFTQASAYRSIIDCTSATCHYSHDEVGIAYHYVSYYTTFLRSKKMLIECHILLPFYVFDFGLRLHQKYHEVAFAQLHRLREWLQGWLFKVHAHAAEDLKLHDILLLSLSAT